MGQGGNWICWRDWMSRIVGDDRLPGAGLLSYENFLLLNHLIAIWLFIVNRILRSLGAGHHEPRPEPRPEPQYPTPRPRTPACRAPAGGNPAIPHQRREHGLHEVLSKRHCGARGFPETFGEFVLGL